MERGGAIPHSCETEPDKSVGMLKGTETGQEASIPILCCNSPCPSTGEVNMSASGINNIIETGSNTNDFIKAKCFNVFNQELLQMHLKLFQ